MFTFLKATLMAMLISVLAVISVSALGHVGGLGGGFGGGHHEHHVDYYVSKFSFPIIPVIFSYTFSRKTNLSLTIPFAGCTPLHL